MLELEALQTCHKCKSRVEVTHFTDLVGRNKLCRACFEIWRNLGREIEKGVKPHEET